jgi:hypothetical protein
MNEFIITIDKLALVYIIKKRYIFVYAIWTYLFQV